MFYPNKSCENTTKATNLQSLHPLVALGPTVTQTGPMATFEGNFVNIKNS